MLRVLALVVVTTAGCDVVFGGYPNAAMGDWETLGPQFEYATVYSHYFTVQAR